MTNKITMTICEERDDGTHHAAAYILSPVPDFVGGAYARLPFALRTFADVIAEQGRGT